MGGGLMQLVAYGAQDVYLSGNPQVTFFKVVYRRHTNFSVEPIQQTWNGAAEFGRTVTCNINRNGDLITNMYVAVSLKADHNNAVSWGYVNRLGHAMIAETKIEIGGSKIDEQYGDWLNIWYELSHKVGQERGYAKMIGDVSELKNLSHSKPAYMMYIPLQFWFNRNDGLALPLIALQYHDVRVTVQFRDFAGCVNYNGLVAPTVVNPMSDSYLLIDYVYLDSEERKRFAQASHEYLIEQLQFTGSESLTSVAPKYRLNFNHPSKYLIWAPHLERYNTRNTWIAHGSNWEAVAERFAKIVAVASSAVASNEKGDAFSSSSTELWINFKEVATSGDILEPVINANASTALKALRAKVEVKCVVQQGGKIPNNTRGLVADGNLLGNLLDNTLVVRNDLTVEDVSKTLDNLIKMGGLNEDVLRLAAISAVDYFNYGNFLDGSDNPVISGKLQLNGHDRFQDRDGNYFNYVQPYQHFSNTPADGINVYSFALKAEDHQPTGTCNFSRIDNATLQVQCGLRQSTASGYVDSYLGASSASVMNIYTVNYNVLRVMSGMAGTAYSN